MASGSVKFAETGEEKPHESGIVVRDMGQNLYAVSLGFLKHNHKYKISFHVEDPFLGCDFDYDPLQSLYVHVDNVEVCGSDSANGHKFIMTLTASKEKLMRETLAFAVVAPKHVLATFQCEPVLKLQLNARVLGRDKGTPALKEGIRSVGVDLDDDSEQSDWQGFD